MLLNILDQFFPTLGVGSPTGGFLLHKIMFIFSPDVSLHVSSTLVEILDIFDVVLKQSKQKETQDYQSDPTRTTALIFCTKNTF